MPEAVVITRPLAQALPLAQQVRESGRMAIVFPLLEILPLPDYSALRAQLQRLDDYGLIAFVSPNAITAAFRLQPNWPPTVPLAVMGEGSRALLAQHGITAHSHTILSPGSAQRSDSQTLLENLDVQRFANKKALIIRGEDGRELLADGLRAAGVAVTQVAAYRRAAPLMNDAAQMQLRELLAAQHRWIVTSSEALRNLLALAADTDPQHGAANACRQHLLVPHARIAETARALGFGSITETGAGDLRLIAALQFAA